MSRTPPKTPAELADRFERKAAAADLEAESAVLVRMATCEGQAAAWRWAAEQVRALPGASVAEGGPMSPEDLSNYRERVRECKEPLNRTCPLYGWRDVERLLADRDHWHAQYTHGCALLEAECKETSAMSREVDRLRDIIARAVTASEDGSASDAIQEMLWGS